MRLAPVFAAALLAAGTVVPLADAQAAPAMSFTSSAFNSTSITSTRGYSFDVVAPGGVWVTGLSFFDEGGDGLAQSHDVGLWSANGSLLASITIPAGTSAPLDVNGLFRIGDIADIFLPTGTGYVVGATFLVNSPDRQAQNFTGLSMDPAIAYTGSRFINNNVPSLTFPASGNPINGYPGGSFELSSVSTPEPTSLALLATGFLGMVYRRRRTA